MAPVRPLIEVVVLKRLAPETDSHPEPRPEPTITLPVVVARDLIWFRLYGKFQVNVCDDEATVQSLLILEVAKIIFPVSPPTVVVELKFGLALVMVTEPVAASTDIPLPARIVVVVL